MVPEFTPTEDQIRVRNELERVLNQIADQISFSESDIASVTTGFLEGIGEINVRKGRADLASEIDEILDGGKLALRDLDFPGSTIPVDSVEYLKTSGLIKPETLSGYLSDLTFGGDLLDFGKQLGYVAAIGINSFKLIEAVYEGKSDNELRALAFELLEDFAVGFAAGLLFGAFVVAVAGPITLPWLIPFLIADVLFGIGFTLFYDNVLKPTTFYLLENLSDLLSNLIDPLAIDLDGDGVNTTSLADSGVTFDLDNNGTEEATGWFEAEDGILFHDWKGATDENGKPVGDGQAQDRSELFANFAELSRHDLNGDGVLDDKDVTPKATEDTNGDGEIDSDDVILPDEDINGDGVIDVNDISPYAQDINENGIIDEDEIDQQTVTGDIDENGTTETIKVGWDQLKVWRDANQNGNVDDGELLSFEELGITSIDLNATELDIEDNGNVVNSESTVTLSDGSTTVINGISFNRDTLNQSYEQQIAEIDTTPEYLSSRLDAFIMPQMQGSGNVPHLLIAGLLDDGVLDAWRAVSEFDGTDLVEFKSLVENLLVKWSGAEDVPHEYRGFAVPQIINAVEAFLGTEYERDGDVTIHRAQADLVINTWDAFLSSMTLRFFAQSSNLNPDNDVVYDFASDTFTGDWSPIISTFEAQYSDPAVTAEDKAVITSLLQSIYSATVAEGDGQDLEVASQVEAIINKPLRAPDQIANFFEEFNVGYEDGDNSPLFITINGNTTVIIPPGFELGDNLKDDNLSFATVSNGSPGVVAQFFPHKISKWQGSDSFISAGLGKDTITVGGPWGQAGANNPFGGLHSTFTTQTYVDSRDNDRDNVLNIGSADALEFSREGSHLLITNVETGSTVLVNSQFSSPSVGVNEINFDGSLRIDSRYLENIASEFSGDGGTLSTAQVGQLAWHRGTSEADGIVGTGDSEVFFGGLRDDVLVGLSGGDTYIYRRGDGNDTIIDGSVLGGTDVLFFEDIASTEVNLLRTATDLRVEIVSSGQVITVQDHFGSGSNQTGIEEINFSDGVIFDRSDILDNVVFRGSRFQDTIFGSDRDDTFKGTKGNDVFVGTIGADTYVYASGDGSDTIIERNALVSDVIDTLHLIDLNRDQVELRRTTEDLFVIDKNTGHKITVISEFFQTVNKFGLERILFANGEEMNRSQMASQAVYFGTDLNDVLSGTSGVDEKFDGNKGDDQLSGFSGSETYYYASGDGNDTIIETSTAGRDDTDTLELTDLNRIQIELLRTGDDLTIVDKTTSEQIVVKEQFGGSSSFNFGIENIRFVDGTSIDRSQILAQAIIRGTVNDDNLSGTGGNDIIEGDAGNDVLRGLGGNDQLFGQDGDDRLEDGSGDDDAFGGAGDDYFVVGTGQNDYDGGEGSDTLDYSAYSTAISLNLETESTAGGGSGNAASNDTFTDIENVIGGFGSDTLIGNDEANRLDGYFGHDELRGEGGNDILVDGSGNDDAYGGEGDDLFIVGTGRNHYDGGEGSDTLDYSAYTTAIRIDLETESTAGGGSGNAASNDTFTNIENVIGTAGNDTLIGSENENSLSGFDGDDILQGQRGDDTLEGGNGADTFIHALGDGADTIIDFDVSEDKIDLSTTRLYFEDILERISVEEGGLLIDLSGINPPGDDEDVNTSFDSIFLSGADSQTLGQLTADNFVLSPVPVAYDDDLGEVAEDTSFVIDTAELLANDRGYNLIGFVEDLVGGSVVLNEETETITFTPFANYFGTARFGYLAYSDDPDADENIGYPAGTVSFTITPVNDAPVVANALGDQSSAEDAAVSFALPADAFSDVDGDALTLSATLAGGATLPAWLSFDAAAGTFSGTPPQNFNGALSVTVTASDGALEASDTFELEITPVNDAPVVANALGDQSSAEDAAVSFALPADAFSDVDGDALTLSATLAGGAALPAWLSFDAAAGTFSGTPPQNFNGALSVTVTASDGALEASDTFELEITPVNDAPVVANALGDQSSAEDAAVSFALPADAFSDVDGDALTLSATLAGGAALPAWLSFDAAAGTFSGTPPQNFNGALSVTVTASDGALEASDTFELEITPVNDAPVVANALGDQSSAEDAAVSFALPADAFSDVDGDALTLSATLAGGAALPAWLSFDAAAGTFSGIPPQNFNGALSVTVTASDGALEASDTFGLEITPVNDAPVVSHEIADQSSQEDSALAFTLPANTFADVDGDNLNVSASLVDGSDLPAWLAFDGANGTFSGTPPEDFNTGDSGAIMVRVTASDGEFETSDDFALEITPVNDAPMANDDTGLAVTAGETVTIAAIGLLANDDDVDGDALEITSVSSTSGNATVALDGDGNITYTSNDGFEGTDAFEYTVSDGELTSNASVSLTVEDSGDPYEGWVQGSQGRDWIFGDLFSSNQIYGAGGNDRLFGGFYSDQIDGGAGNDRIFGLWGDDTLNGNEGRDRIFGGSGNDVIAGNEGNDRLWGGWGQDTFVFNEGDGRDRIMDFDTGQRPWWWYRSGGDTISINVDDINNYDDLMGVASQQGRHTVFDFGDGDKLVLSYTRLAALDQDAFTFF